VTFAVAGQIRTLIANGEAIVLFIRNLGENAKLDRDARPARIADARHKDLASSPDTLDHGGVNLHCHRSLQHLDRQEELAPVLLANQQPFQPSQWTCHNPYSIATSEEGVGLCFDRTLNHPSDRLDLHIGYARRLTSTSHHHVNAWSCKDGEPLDEGTTKEDVTRKEGERNTLDAVFPLMSGRIKGKERFKPFPRQGLMDTFLMLMPSVKSIPRVTDF